MPGDLIPVEGGILWALPPALMWCGVLCWFDCRRRRLPNWLTIGGAVVAFAWRLGYGEWPRAFLDGFAAAMGAGLFLLLPFLMHGAGGGDVKMLFAAGAIVGLGRVVAMLLVTSAAGVLLGVVMLVTGRLDGARLKHFFRCLFDWRYDRKAGAARLPPKESERVRIPFSIPITAGMVVALLQP